MEIFVHLPRRMIQVYGRTLLYGNGHIGSFTFPHHHYFSPQRIICSSQRSYCYVKRKITPLPKEEESLKEEESAELKKTESKQERGIAKSNVKIKEDSKALSNEDSTEEKLSTKVKKVESEWEEDEKRRYEHDLPPKEEERHKYWKSREERSINKSLVRVDFFQNLKDKNKENFLMAVEIFSQRDVHSRGHVEFIYAAMSQMKAFGLHRDLESYKKILDVFPKGKMIQQNMWQVEFMHYPKQQQCATDLLEQMEDYGVMPDTEVQQMLTNVFGSQSFPMRKASRMLYWMPKFKHLSPWPVPEHLPDDALELAKLAIHRITSVDLTTKITIYDTGDLIDAVDQTWIVSGQSLEQQKLIESHPSDQPIYVEGAFRVWLSRVCINYFILRAEPKSLSKKKPADPDDVSNLSTIFEEDSDAVIPMPSLHEQDDGVILGVCATGSSSRDSVVSWIRFLEEQNKRLGKDISILFTLKSPIGPTDDLEITSLEEDIDPSNLIGENRKSIGASGAFSGSSGGKLGIHQALPSLKQVGVWSESETVFANWPHHHHPEDSPSALNLKENQRLAEEIEIITQQRNKSLKDKKKLDNPDESKRIE